MGKKKFQLVETGLLASLIVILVAIIYIIAGGNLGELLAKFI